MRVARVYTNETCTQNCSFCNTRRSVERRDFVASGAVRARIDAAAEAAEIVVLTGGEPSMRRDLAELVRHATQAGATCHLETNGTGITGDRASALAHAGLALARVHLPAWGELGELITRDEGSFARAIEAMRGLGSAGVAVEVSTPVVRRNADLVPEMPGHLASLDLPVAALVLGVPIDGPDPAALVSLPAAAAIIERTEAAARRHGIRLRLDPHTHVPPCLFRDVPRVAHLFTLTPGGSAREGHAKLEPCSACDVADRCPGVPAGAVGDVAGLLRPLTDDRARRRLSVISTVEDQIRRELYQDEIHRPAGSPAIASRTVRINFRCNQVCRFCFVSTHLESAEHAEVERVIVEMARTGGMVVISGGEPTLNPRVVDYVRLAKREGASYVELQTNATRLADGDYADRLAEAGVDQAFVSLHGSCAEISDAITGAPGTFEKTVAGIDRAVRAAMDVRLNFVFCEMNFEDFPRYVEMVARRWPGMALTISFVAASTDVVPRTRDLIPRYSDVLPHLTRGLELGRAAGLRMSGFDSMCGIPLCLVPEDVAPYYEIADVPPGFDRGEFIHAEPCRTCELSTKCFGVRRGYATLHGTSELRPVARAHAHR